LQCYQEIESMAEVYIVDEMINIGGVNQDLARFGFRNRNSLNFDVATEFLDDTGSHGVLGIVLRGRLLISIGG